MAITKDDSLLASALVSWRKSLPGSITQAKLAQMLEISRGAIANWEAGIQAIPKDQLNKLRNIGFQGEVSSPTIPAPLTATQIPYIGYVTASSPVNWTDPYASEDFEYISAPELDLRGCFSCRVESDSMMPYLSPGDLLIFRGTSIPKVGKIVLYRSPDSLLTVKVLKHDGEKYLLHATNPRIEPVEAVGSCIGFLIGVHKTGRPNIKIEENSGLSPQDFHFFI